MPVAVAIQTVGPLSLLVFPASSFHLYAATLADGQVAPVAPSEVLALSGAEAALDGPMFGLCSGQGGASYATSRCDQVGYTHYDASSGLHVPSQHPGRGITIAVVGGRATAAQGDLPPSGASVAVQLYPMLVWQGQNTASTAIDTDVVWRAGLAVMQDGRLALAVMRSSMYDFADALVNSGAVFAGYTDGGGSTALVTAGGVTGSTEGRPVASWLVVKDRSSALWLEAVGVALAAAVGSYLWLRKKRVDT